MNLTYKENNTLLRWAIFPAESDDYIANATAMVKIVSTGDVHYFGL